MKFKIFKSETWLYHYTLLDSETFRIRFYLPLQDDSLENDVNSNYYSSSSYGEIVCYYNNSNMYRNSNVFLKKTLLGESVLPFFFKKYHNFPLNPLFSLKSFSNCCTSSVCLRLELRSYGTLNFFRNFPHILHDLVNYLLYNENIGRITTNSSGSLNNYKNFEVYVTNLIKKTRRSS